MQTENGLPTAPAPAAQPSTFSASTAPSYSESSLRKSVNNSKAHPNVSYGRSSMPQSQSRYPPTVNPSLQLPPNNPRPQQSLEPLIDGPVNPSRRPSLPRPDMGRRLSDTARRIIANTPSLARTNSGHDRSRIQDHSMDESYTSEARLNSQNEKPQPSPTAPRMRRYRSAPGDLRFLLKGRLVSSGDAVWPFVASTGVAILMPTLFLVFESDWLWHQLGAGGKAAVVIYAYLFVLSGVNMARTALRDPGIIPPNLDRPDMELIAVPHGSPEDRGGGMGERPKPRNVRFRDQVIVSKWCPTCETYRPPRTSHCRLCDVCTEMTDHHCSFLNCCIGRRNYSSFLVFLISAVLLCYITISLSVVHIYLLYHRNPSLSIFTTWQPIGSLIVVVIAFGISIPLSGLLGYHCMLCWVGKTTVEMLRPTYAISEEKQESVPKRGRGAYILSRLCRPFDDFGWLRGPEWALADDREINPSQLASHGIEDTTLMGSGRHRILA